MIIIINCYYTFFQGRGEGVESLKIVFCFSFCNLIFLFVNCLFFVFLFVLF